jgi:hypothetical protein
MKGMNEIITVMWMLFADYMAVLLLIGADLWSGVRKAKMRGEIRSSYMYKKTVDKIARYYNALLALTIVDVMQMGGMWYMDNYYDYHLPIFPFITFMASIGIGMIEIKSIFEKAEDKVKFEYQQIGVLATELAKSKADPAEIAKAVVDYINKDNGKEGKDAESK